MMPLLVAVVLLAGSDPLESEGKAAKPGKPPKIVKTPEGTCDKKQLDQTKKALAAPDAVGRETALVSEGLALGCEGKLPKPIGDALLVMHKTEIDQHGPEMALAMHDEPDFVKAGCPKWDETFTPVAHAAPGDKLRAIYKGCNIAKMNVLTEEEFANSPDLGAAYVLAPLYTFLTVRGMPAPVAKTWLRSLLAVPAKQAVPSAEKKPVKKGK